MSRRALGRGLEALIPQPAAAREGVRMVAIGDLRPNPKQPRKAFSEEGLESLAASIRNHGVLLPLVARPTAHGFEIVAGERRWRAAQRAGLKEVPVLVRQVEEAESLELALVENLQREDLNPIEVARAYEQLQEERGWTQEELAAAVGQSRPAVANLMRLLQLPRQVQQQVRDGALTAGHARALLGLPTAAEQCRLGAEVEERRLSVRQTEERVRRLRRAARGRKRPPQEAGGFAAQRRHLEEQLRRSLGTRVHIEGDAARGRVELHYHSSEELDALLERLLPG
ncbi:MAG: ParB/RepB/Spo0J family partition protein [Nitrospirae bacterium]|nr:MAG: ParB/RepB/Spo0J family partition protein [Nitrospirota bacterium]